MTWPTSQTTTSLDADTDTLQNARSEVKGLADKFNLLVAHVSAYMQGLLGSADAAAARTTLDVPARNGAGAAGNWPINAQGLSATLSVATGGTGATTAAAAFTALKQAASETATGVVELATTAEAKAADASRVLTGATMKAAQIQLGTAITASGSAIDFTGIPAWANRVVISVLAVSTNGTSIPVIRLGTSSGIESAGYSCNSANISGSTQSSNRFTDAVATLYNVAVLTSVAINGSIVLQRVLGNKWTASGCLHRDDGNVSMWTAGAKALPSALTQVRLTTQSGTDVFDAGEVNISWE